MPAAVSGPPCSLGAEGLGSLRLPGHDVRLHPVTWQGDAGSFLHENAHLQNLTSLLSGFLVFCRNSFMSGHRC